MAKKIIILGRPSVGKTSIKKVIFEGHDSNALIKQPLSPTRGVETNVYSWMGLDLGIFDFSGQELTYLLKEEKSQINYFKNLNAIIYVIDASQWELDYKAIIGELNVIFLIIQIFSIKAQFVLFLHKSDLIINKKNSIKKIKRDVLDKINPKLISEIYVTSIIPDYLYSTYNAFCQILGNFSKEVFELKKIVDKALQNYSKTFCIIINQKNSIILQSIRDDIKHSVIRDIYYRISNETLISDKTVSIAVQIEITDTGPLIKNIFKDNEGVSHPSIKNFIYVFEDLNKKRVESLMRNVREKIERYHMKWAKKHLFVK